MRRARQRAAVTLAALALLAAAASPAPAPASYDALASGKTTIKLSKRFARFLDRHHVRLQAKRGARRRGRRRLVLPVSGGRLDPTTGKGKVENGGVLIFRHGRRKLPFREVELKAKRTPLFAKVGGGQLKVARARRLRVRRAGFGARLTATSLALTRKVATRLNKKLRTGRAFEKGQVIGFATSRARPLTATVLDVGRATLTPAPAFLAKLNAHFVSLNPIAPAERAPGSLLTVPLIPRGALAPDASLGILRTGGAIELLALGSGKILWNELWFDFGAHAVLAEVDIEPTPTFPGKLGQQPILALGQGGALSYPKTRTITVSGAPLTLNAITAGHFNLAFAGGEVEFRPGEFLGVVTFTAQAQ